MDVKAGGKRYLFVAGWTEEILNLDTQLHSER